MLILAYLFYSTLQFMNNVPHGDGVKSEANLKQVSSSLNKFNHVYWRNWRNCGGTSNLSEGWRTFQPRTPNFNPGLFNPELFNPRLFNHELLSHGFGMRVTGVSGSQWHPKLLTDQLTIFQQGEGQILPTTLLMSSQFFSPSGIPALTADFLITWDWKYRP